MTNLNPPEKKFYAYAAVAAYDEHLEPAKGQRKETQRDDPVRPFDPPLVSSIKGTWRIILREPLVYFSAALLNVHFNYK